MKQIIFREKFPTIPTNIQVLRKKGFQVISKKKLLRVVIKCSLTAGSLYSAG